MPPGGLHLRALSSRFDDRPPDALGLALDQRRLELALEGRRRSPGGAYAAPVADDGVQAHVVGRPRGLGPARELDHVGDERGELVELGDDVVAQAVLLRRRRGARRRAAAGCWRAGSRSGVRSSWLASATRLRCASTDCSSASSVVLKLCASRAISSRPETSSRCDGSGLAVSDSVRRVKRAIGRERRARDHDAPAPRRAMIPPAPTRISSRSWSLSTLSTSGQRARHLHGAALADALRQHAHVGAGHGGVAVGVPQPAWRRSAFARRVDGRPGRHVRRADHLAAGRDDLHVARGLAEARRRRPLAGEPRPDHRAGAAGRRRSTPRAP